MGPQVPERAIHIFRATQTIDVFSIYNDCK